jgi:hypothetical protein
MAPSDQCTLSIIINQMLKILVHISIVTLYYGHVPLWTWVLHLATASNDIKFRVNSLIILFMTCMSPCKTNFVLRLGDAPVLYYGHVPLWTWVLHLATASNDINDIKFRVNSLIILFMTCMSPCKTNFG